MKPQGSEKAIQSIQHIDLVPLEIISPPEIVCPDGIVAVYASVVNAGDVTRTFDVAFLVDEGTEYHDTVTVHDLPPDSVAIVTFSHWQIGYCQQNSWFDMKVITLDPGDMNPWNDILLDSTKCLFWDGKDWGLIGIPSPPDTIFPDSFYTPSAVIENYGTMSVYGWVRFEIGPSYQDSAWVSGLVTHEIRRVYFTDWCPPSGSDSLTACATLIVDDWNPGNDTLCKQLHLFTGLCDDSERASSVCRLFSNHPNPAKSQTTIAYEIAEPVVVKLTVHDIAGRVVERLVNETQKPGIHKAQWDRKGNPSGIYFCRLKAGEFVKTRKMVVVG